MPLQQGSSQEILSANISELISSGYKPKQAQAIALSESRKTKDSDSNRNYDINGWAEIKDNPLSKVGVFQYSGAQISADLDPDQIYNVFRSEEELNNQETIDSFKLIPWTDDHEMLGKSDEGLTPAELKGVHGVIGENVFFDDGYLKGNLKIFSDELADLIEKGKKELSIGYRCLYEHQSGVYNNERYEFVQKKIRGNHLALVDEGRAGHDVCVLDYMKFTIDSKEIKNMADLENKEFEKEKEDLSKGDVSKPEDENNADLNDKEKKDGYDADEKMSIEEAREMFAKLSKYLETMSETKDEIEPDDFVKKAEVVDAEKNDDENAKGMDMKLMLKEISERDSLADQLSQHVGTFDHKDKTLAEVAEYGVKKLGLSCDAGHAKSVLAGYLAGSKLSQSAVIAQDSRPASSMVDTYLKGSK